MVAHAELAAQTCLPGVTTFSTQAQIDSFSVNYPGCTIIEGDLIFNESAIYNLHGLSVLTAIEGDLYMEENNWLADFIGFDNLTYIGGDLHLDEPEQESLTGFESLQFVGGDLILNEANDMTNLEGLQSLVGIDGSLLITESAFRTLDGMSSLQYVGVNFIVEEAYNMVSFGNFPALDSVRFDLELRDNDSLQSVAGLLGLRYVGGRVEFMQNPMLNTLHGLDSIDHTQMGYLLLEDNDSLSFCSVKSICNYLLDGIGPSDVDFNTTGCNVESEITAICLMPPAPEPTGLDETDSDFLIWPNPASDWITWSGRPAVSSVTLFNTLGGAVRQSTAPSSGISVAGVPPGLYFLEAELRDGGQIRRSVLIH